VVTQKEHLHDLTALLLLQEMLQHKVPVEGIQAAQSLALMSVSCMATNGAPPSTWAKPTVEVNMAAMDGKVTGMPEVFITAGQILHELDGTSVLSSKGSINSASSAFVEMNIHHGKTSSVLLWTSAENLNTISPAHTTLEDIIILAPHQAAAERGLHTKVLIDLHSWSLTASSTMHNATDPDGSFFSWTSSLTSAMQYMLKTKQPLQPATPAAKNHHGLLYANPLAINKLPHIKYEWTIGKWLKFSYTVYYVKQFYVLCQQ
jgi:1-phosphatidylinositol-3-phosphate 5-kinase